MMRQCLTERRERSRREEEAYVEQLLSASLGDARGTGASQVNQSRNKVRKCDKLARFA
jgi:hypothetical protein